MKIPSFCFTVYLVIVFCLVESTRVLLPIGLANLSSGVFVSLTFSERSPVTSFSCLLFFLRRTKRNIFSSSSHSNLETATIGEKRVRRRFLINLQRKRGRVKKVFSLEPKWAEIYAKNGHCGVLFKDIDSIEHRALREDRHNHAAPITRLRDEGFTWEGSRSRDGRRQGRVRIICSVSHKENQRKTEVMASINTRAHTRISCTCQSPTHM